MPGWSSVLDLGGSEGHLGVGGVSCRAGSRWQGQADMESDADLGLQAQGGRLRCRPWSSGERVTQM